MQPQTIATRCADSESGEVRAALAEGVPCNALTGGPVSPGFFEKLSAFFRQGSFKLEFPFLAALKLGLILHWRARSAPQCFSGGGFGSTDFSLWILGLARTKPHRLKSVLLRETFRWSAMPEPGLRRRYKAATSEFRRPGANLRDRRSTREGSRRMPRRRTGW